MQEINNDNKKDESEELIKIRTISNTNPANGRSQGKKLGVTQEYTADNRKKLWDSTKDKNAYRDKVFGDKQTYVDPISGKTLHKTQKAAQNKYHMRNKEGEKISSAWSRHHAEVDHKITIKEFHEKVKDNPFFSDVDLKEIVNNEDNYRLLSKADNVSKGAASDADMKCIVKTTGRVVKRTGENIAGEFSLGVSDAVVNSAIPLMMEGIDHMIKVAQGEEDFSDVAENMGKTTVELAVMGGTERLLVDSVVNTSVLKKIVQSEQFSQILSVAIVVQNSATRYLNGEINGKEFIDEIGTDGTTMVASMIAGEVGQSIGKMIGGIIGSGVSLGIGTIVGMEMGTVVGKVLGVVISTLVCNLVVSSCSTIKHLDDYKLKEEQIKKLESDALHEMSHQREKFKSIIEEKYCCWNEEIQYGFDMIMANACKENYSFVGVTEGLDRILSVFGKTVAFHTLDEYEKQLDTTVKLCF